MRRCSIVCGHVLLTLLVAAPARPGALEPSDRASVHDASVADGLASSATAQPGQDTSDENPDAASVAPEVPAPLRPPVMVMLHDTPVFALRAYVDKEELDKRVDSVQLALEEAVTAATPDKVRVEQRGDVAIVFVDQLPIVQLNQQDALLAGDQSLALHAAQVAARIKDVIRKERQRSALAQTVFSLSLVVFLGLLALFLMRKLGHMATRSRDYLLTHHDASLSLRLKSVDLVGPAAMRSGLLVGLSVGKWVALIGIVYSWLLLSFSLFPSTRAYTDRLTGFVLGPVSDLLSRVARSLPLLAVALLGVLAVVLLVRFVGLFFASVERGETRLGWLPYDLTTPASILLRAGIILAALVFGAPIITGNAEGVLARSGLLMLAAIGLSATPLLASVAIGVMVVFWRRIRVGEYAELGGQVGKVIGVDLLAVRLQDAHGSQVQVPHLLALLKPGRSLGRLPVVKVELRVARTPRVRELCQVLTTALTPAFHAPQVELVSFSADDVCLFVRVAASMAHPDLELHAAIVGALEPTEFQLLSASLRLGSA